MHLVSTMYNNTAHSAMSRTCSRADDQVPAEEPSRTTSSGHVCPVRQPDLLPELDARIPAPEDVCSTAGSVTKSQLSSARTRPGRDSLFARLLSRVKPKRETEILCSERSTRTRTRFYSRRRSSAQVPADRH
ncbi:hypothetical protein EXIGLDRAFT_847854, partial [Exidia glandulosa HHB12029]